MAYYYVQHTGLKGFVTHADNEANHVSNYPGDVWITSGSAWAARVGATEETKAQAQAKANVVKCDLLSGIRNRIETRAPVSGL